MFDATTTKIIRPWIKNHMSTGDLIRAAESGGDPYAKNPNSTASGPDQFLNSTWLDTIRIARPDLAGQPDEALLALKTNPEISGQVRDAYAAQNGAILSKAGQPVTPATTYLAHFAGPQGAVGVLSADPATPIDRLMSPEAIKANPFLRGMTAGDLRAWADRKMGGGQTAPATPASPANGPVAAPLNLIPQQAPPIFAPPPQQQAQAPQSAPAPFEQIPPMQMQPIFTPPRKQVDLSKLRAAFQPQPFFPRG